MEIPDRPGPIDSTSKLNLTIYRPPAEKRLLRKHASSLRIDLISACTIPLNKKQFPSQPHRLDGEETNRNGDNRQPHNRPQLHSLGSAGTMHYKNAASRQQP